MDIYSSSQTDEITQALNKGKTVAFGTDTVFGLACIIGNNEAIERIYTQKRREKSKKLPMMFSSVDMMNHYVKISPKTKNLINKFSPGPITYILETIDSKETIACRIPNDEWIIDLINKINKPLYVTSANISGEENILKYEEVKDKVEADVLVKKDAKGDKASTIVDATNNYQIFKPNTCLCYNVYWVFIFLYHCEERILWLIKKI